MKNPFRSRTTKYIVNVLMGGIFVALAYTGLFGGEGGVHEQRPGERHGSRHEHFTDDREQFERVKTYKTAGINPVLEINGEHEDKNGGNHEIYA